jgi:BlaI family penicillinase repressor
MRAHGRRSIGPPTEAELEILRVLWARGPSTVREVYEALAPTKGIGYTTVLKQMRVMLHKGLLVRSERFRSHLYEVAQERSAIERQLAAAVLQIFDGSARGLLQSALAGRKVDRRELAEIRELLDEYERRNR